MGMYEKLKLIQTIKKGRKKQESYICEAIFETGVRMRRKAFDFFLSGGRTLKMQAIGEIAN